MHVREYVCFEKKQKMHATTLAITPKIQETSKELHACVK